MSGVLTEAEAVVVVVVVAAAGVVVVVDDEVVVGPKLRFGCWAGMAADVFEREAAEDEEAASNEDEEEEEDWALSDRGKKWFSGRFSWDPRGVDAGVS